MEIEALNIFSNKIIGAAIEVHKTLGGPGLLESVYEEALAWEMQDRGLLVQRQVNVPLHYKKRRLAHSLRLDLLVEKQIIVEVKATATYHPIYEAQLLTYLKLMNLRLGLVINFGQETVKEGIERVINGYDDLPKTTKSQTPKSRLKRAP
ncbi:MAG: GxxExxY protein [Anaerolineales bacterium]|nr:GxxExxY protein [Anaerolineales bacterium]